MSNSRTPSNRQDRQWRKNLPVGRRIAPVQRWNGFSAIVAVVWRDNIRKRCRKHLTAGPASDNSDTSYPTCLICGDVYEDLHLGNSCADAPWAQWYGPTHFAAAHGRAAGGIAYVFGESCAAFGQSRHAPGSSRSVGRSDAQSLARRDLFALDCGSVSRSDLGGFLPGRRQTR